MGTATADGRGVHVHLLRTRHLQAVTQGKGDALQNGLRHVGARRIHAHTHEGASSSRVVVRCPLAHKVGQEVDAVLAEIGLLDALLLRWIVSRADNVLDPPPCAACGREDAAHEVPTAVCGAEGVQLVLLVAEIALCGDEDGASRTHHDVAVAGTHRPRAHGSSRVVACAGTDLHAVGKTQRIRDIGHDLPYDLGALEEFGHLALAQPADGKHGLAPALVLHVQKQSARRVGEVRGVHTGKTVVNVVLGEHHSSHAAEVLGLLLAHPQELWCGEAGVGDVSRVPREGGAAHVVVEVVNLVACAAVVPEYGRANDPIVLV